MNKFRIKRSRLILVLLVVCVLFWFCLYWSFSQVYSQHKIHRFHSMPDVQDLFPKAGGNDEDEIDIYSELILENMAKIKTADDQRKHDAGYQNHAFNQMLSDKLSYTRPLPDIRQEGCKEKEYSLNLPKVSIVICFFNEALSALLRTVITALARSPEHLIHEIILIDDDSEFEYLKTDLDNYIERELPKVKIFHSWKRLGLIRARMYGAEKATGQVLLFLDSHCEVNVGWLEPLLAAIHSDPHTVAVPIMDIIDSDTFFYEPSGLVKGGFNWGMHYQWDPLSKTEVKKVRQNLEPYVSPTMAGGLFAMDRLYFHQLGEYDKGMDIWGGENLELSFRIWQCGGHLVIAPCSRVGHIFRKRRPYGAPIQDSFTKNTLRMVYVWLDEYKKYYFHINPNAEDMEFGNITARIQLRKKLNCKSFKWYLENVYPEQLSKLPDLNHSLYPNQPINNLKTPAKALVRARGLLKHRGSGLCVESEKTVYDKRALLQLAICKPQEKDQFWFETEQKDLRLANLLCLDYDADQGPFARLMKCKGSNTQTWIWSGQGAPTQLMNAGTRQCLTATGVEPGALLKTMQCSDSPLMQFSYVRM